ncbi:nuclear transport factor 2 family protein [Variovorax paradoxus]|uniref:Nuclear transport factor 2 family protein n=1 Tax=Variovorax paradoxus TaxID=34073 RepID=A0A6I6HFL7_VARPD|nr:nuclear transport factor 2 family protein [Variovorax paradoxus]QGW82504.1 nuclear transport factor 2 family protein [Variovorax paradoxus]
MSTEKNIQTVKDFFTAISHGDREALLALVAEDVEWIIPGEDWPLAGTRHGHAGLADLLETASAPKRWRGAPGSATSCQLLSHKASSASKYTSTKKQFPGSWLRSMCVLQ